MKFPWSKKEQKLLPEAAIPAQKLTLKDRFSIARYGRYCRTSTFSYPGQDHGRKWLKAVEDTLTEQWCILEVTEKPDMPGNNVPGSASLQVTKILEKDFKFFDAMNFMAVYETQQPALHYEMTEPGAKELGMDHFMAFAGREGIAFDAGGMPHPTEGGLIVTAGSFASDTEERLKKWMENMPSVKKWGRGALQQYFNADNVQGIIDRTILNGKKLGEFTRFIKEQGYILYIATEYYGKSFDNKTHDVGALSKLMGMDSEDYEEYYSKSHKYKGTASSNIAHYLLDLSVDWIKRNLDGNTQAHFLTMLEKQRFNFELFSAKGYWRVISSGEHSDADDHKLLNQALFCIEKSAVKLGYNAEQINEFRALPFLAEELDPVPDVVAFIEECKKMQQQMKDDVEQKNQKLLSPPAPVP